MAKARKKGKPASVETHRPRDDRAPARPAQARAPNPRPWPWALLPAALAVVVFAQVHGFALLEWDDRTNIRDNPFLVPFTSANLARFWKQSYAGLYIPLTYSALMVEARLAENPQATDRANRFDPAVFHLGNLALHLVVIALVFTILRLLVGHPGAAALGASLFAIHPLQVESVAWATEIKGLLCAAFSLLALGQYLLAANARPITLPPEHWSPISPARRRLHYALACVALVGALLAKPSAAALPLVALAIEACLLRSDWRSVVWRLGPWLAVAGVVLVVTKRLQPDEVLAVYKPRFYVRPLVALDAVMFYLWKLAWPWPLGPDYGRSPLSIIESKLIYITWLVPAAVVAVMALSKDRRIWWAGLAVFVAALAPVLGLVPFGFQSHSTVADRYAYPGMLGIALLAAWWLAGHWRPAWQGTAVVVLVGLALLGYRQTGFWRDDHTLFAHNLEAVNPESYVSLSNIGVAIERQALRLEGPMRTKLLEEALPYFQRAIEIAPHFDDARQHQAFVLSQLGRYDQAIAAYHEFLRLRPGSPTGHRNLANLYVQLGKIDEALPLYQRSVELEPSYANGWIGLGTAELYKGNRTAAEAAFRRALAIDPRLASARRGLAIAQGQSQ